MLSIKNNAYPEITYKYSIRVGWVPLKINNKPIATKIIPLYKMTEKLFNCLDLPTKIFLQEYSSGNNSIGQRFNENPANFLKKNKSIYHGFFITYNKKLILLAINCLHYGFFEKEHFSGIHISYVEKKPLIYPDHLKLPYLGNYPKDKNSYEVKGPVIATIGQAAAFILDIFPKNKFSNYYQNDKTAIEFKTNFENIKNIARKYNFTLKKDGTILISYKQAEEFYYYLSQDYSSHSFPNNNGLCYKNPTSF